MLLILIASAAAAILQAETVPSQNSNSGHVASPEKFEDLYRSASFEVNTVHRSRLPKEPNADSASVTGSASAARAVSEKVVNSVAVTSPNGNFLERSASWTLPEGERELRLRAWNGTRLTIVKPRQTVEHYVDGTPEKLTAFPYGPVLQAAGFSGSLKEFQQPEAFTEFRQFRGKSPESDVDSIVYERRSGKKGTVNRVIRLYFSATNPAQPICCQSFTDTDGVQEVMAAVTVLDWTVQGSRLEYAFRVETPQQPVVLTKVHGEQIREDIEPEVFELNEFAGNPFITSFVSGRQISQANYFAERKPESLPSTGSVLLQWCYINDGLLVCAGVFIFIKRRQCRARSAALVAAISMFQMQAGCSHQESGPIVVEFPESPGNTIPQWETFRMEFLLKGAEGNPFDSRDISVEAEFTSPSGKRSLHPAFFRIDHTVAIENGRESVRETGLEHWEVRWTPTEVGTHRWVLHVKSGQKHGSHSGEFHCEPGEGSGFVRLSKQDPRYFETSDGSFFYPVGHHTRSPEDTRSNAGEEDSQKYGRLRTEKYRRWFQQMSQNGENFCELWMSPWWLGLEWTPSQPGYQGVGHYNQIHAAQLDRILELAEQYGIRVMLYTMNHGQLSTVIDREWSGNPFNSGNGGPVDSPTEYLKSVECFQRQQDRLRYILARWGHSTSLFGITLCSEIDWIDPFYGEEAPDDSTVADGVAQDKRPIQKDRSGVEAWFARLAQYVRNTDCHGHLVTVQRSHLEDSQRLWANPEFDVIFPNSYRTQLESSLVTKQLDRPACGIADGCIGLTRHFQDQKKPVLIAEWGGHHLQNPPAVLGADLHTGIWAMSMSELSGVTGFWWWIDLDHANLYGNFRALSAFWNGVDRRNKGLTSRICPVRFRMPIEKDRQEIIPHATREAILLANDSELYGYIYDLHMNMGNVPAARHADVRYTGHTEFFVDLPPQLKAGRYRIEYWDTFKGAILETDEVTVGEKGLLPVRNCGTDVALRMTRLAVSTDIQTAAAQELRESLSGH